MRQTSFDGEWPKRPHTGNHINVARVTRNAILALEPNSQCWHARASNGIASINRNDRSSVQMNDRRARIPKSELHLRVSLPFHHVPEAELLPERDNIYELHSLVVIWA